MPNCTFSMEWSLVEKKYDWTNTYAETSTWIRVKLSGLASKWAVEKARYKFLYRRLKSFPLLVAYAYKAYENKRHFKHISKKCIHAILSWDTFLDILAKAFLAFSYRWEKNSSKRGAREISLSCKRIFNRIYSKFNHLEAYRIIGSENAANENINELDSFNC